MKKLELLSLLALGASMNSHAACPLTDSGETAQDCPWAEITRSLEPLSGEFLRAIETKAPGLIRGIREDARSFPVWGELWGESINFDELAKSIIVSPPTLSDLLKPFGKTTHDSHNRQIAPAGIEHTYGYLFSNLRTAYGYKRQRWVRATLEKGFGLPEGTLGPTPAQGSLLRNATYFAGRIAFRGEKNRLALLEKVPGVSSAARTFDFGKLQTVRLEETVVTPTGKIILRTDFVPFLNPVPGETNTHWLIYSVQDFRPGKAGASQLITAFPVETGFVQMALKPDGLGDDKPIVTRYNAYVEGFTFQKLKGVRKRY